MPTDLINQTVTLKDGRRLGFAEYGASTGRPVFHFHGSGSSRFEHPSAESMLDLMGIRFISVDRPGHGLSDFQPQRRLVDWPGDVCYIADHLGIGEFYVEGYSAGAPHALACAHQLPERVLAGAVYGCVAPMNRPGAYQGLPFFNRPWQNLPAVPLVYKINPLADAGNGDGRHRENNSPIDVFHSGRG